MVKREMASREELSGIGYVSVPVVLLLVVTATSTCAFVFGDFSKKYNESKFKFSHKLIHNISIDNHLNSIVCGLTALLLTQEYVQY